VWFLLLHHCKGRVETTFFCEVELAWLLIDESWHQDAPVSVESPYLGLRGKVLVKVGVLGCVIVVRVQSRSVVWHQFLKVTLLLLYHLLLLELHRRLGVAEKLPPLLYLVVPWNFLTQRNHLVILLRVHFALRSDFLVDCGWGCSSDSIGWTSYWKSLCHPFQLVEWAFVGKQAWVTLLNKSDRLCGQGLSVRCILRLPCRRPIAHIFFKKRLRRSRF